MEKEIVYIADLDQDVDDVVAAHYLHNEGVLKCVVCDPYPMTEDGLKRKDILESLGVQVLKKMPPVAKYVFVGGALTLVADYIKMHHIDWLVMNGGFYKIVAIGTNTETEEKMVAYQNLKDQRVWIRPYDMFISKVDREKYPNAYQPYRFIKVKITA